MQCKPTRCTITLYLEHLASLLGIRNTVTNYKLRGMNDIAVNLVHIAQGIEAQSYRMPSLKQSLMLHPYTAFNEDLKMAPGLSTISSLKKGQVKNQSLLYFQDLLCI